MNYSELQFVSPNYVLSCFCCSSGFTDEWSESSVQRGILTLVQDDDLPTTASQRFHSKQMGANLPRERSRMELGILVTSSAFYILVDKSHGGKAKG